MFSVIEQWIVQIHFFGLCEEVACCESKLQIVRGSGNTCVGRFIVTIDRRNRIF